MASRRKKFQNDARTRVLRLLSENPHLSTRQVADDVGISNGSAYYLLSAHVAKGVVKLENSKNS